MDEELSKWQTTASKYLVKDRWLTLRADTCLTPAGQIIEPWYVMEYPDWIDCLVVDRDNQVILLQHYRYAMNEYVTEIVSGAVDPEGETPETTAIRELREEIGYKGGEMYKVGVSYANPSNQTNKLYAFLAIGGDATEKPIKEIGADFRIMRMPFRDFVSSITDPANTDIYQSLNLASIFLALNYIRQADTDSPDILRLRRLLIE